jgi:hypothetical protein
MVMMTIAAAEIILFMSFCLSVYTSSFISVMITNCHTHIRQQGYS